MKKTPSPLRTSIHQLLSDGKVYSIKDIVSHLNKRCRDCRHKQWNLEELQEEVASMLQKMLMKGVIRCTIDGHYQIVIPPPSSIDDEVIFNGLSHKLIGKLAETSLVGLLNNRLVAKGSRNVCCTDLKALNAKEGQQLSWFQRKHVDWIRGIIAVRNEMGLSLADLETVTSVDQSMLQNKLEQMIREGKILKTQLDRYKPRI